MRLLPIICEAAIQVDLPPPQPASAISLPAWKLILRKNFTRLETLVDYLELSPEQCDELLNRPNFALNVPLRLAQKMAKRTLDDPLVRQFLPLKKEMENHPLFGMDPVGDELCRRESSLLHKYQGRVLLVCTSACAMHCRYCFRQNFSYDTKNKSFSHELALIRKDNTIHEVILSGGDPLSLPDEWIQNLFSELEQIEHVKRIRFHTRFPIGIPERINASFLEIVEQCSKQLFFVIHVNHPKELDADIFDRLKALQKRGCVLLNQSVLLRGVNDQADVMTELCESLADHGILPYYLHQLDRVKGVSHFEVEEIAGLQLMKEVSGRLSGYAVPRYVREIIGEPGKTVINSTKI
ncbi:MAG: KamA family radical SAM protein [Candidatus Protochlamydia sp.]|nr:KamA family radical SAM protein [Candidatus Protochlamydia sp.]